MSLTDWRRRLVRSTESAFWKVESKLLVMRLVCISRDCLFVDTDVLFRQDSKFHYLFGVKEPDFYGAIETDTKKAILFIPHLPESFAVWMGPIHTTEYYKDLYMVDEVLYTDDINAYLEKFGS